MIATLLLLGTCGVFIAVAGAFLIYETAYLILERYKDLGKQAYPVIAILACMVIAEVACCAIACGVLYEAYLGLHLS